MELQTPYSLSRGAPSAARPALQNSRLRAFANGPSGHAGERVIRDFVPHPFGASVATQRCSPQPLAATSAARPALQKICTWHQVPVQFYQQLCQLQGDIVILLKEEAVALSLKGGPLPLGHLNPQMSLLYDLTAQPVLP